MRKIQLFIIINISLLLFPLKIEAKIVTECLSPYVCSSNKGEIGLQCEDDPQLVNCTYDDGTTPGGSSDLKPNEIQNPTLLDDLGEVISQVSKFVAPVAVLGFIFCVIYAGYVRMFALGNAEKEAKSMKIAISAAIGFAIIALAPVIVRIIGNILKVDEEII